jgi:hypothetical protein
MDVAKVIERYGVYYHTIRKLADFPLTHTVTIEELAIPRALLQRAYKEIKREGFNSNLIDYFCYVSTQFVIIGAKEALKDRMQTKADEKEGLTTELSAVLTLEANKHNVMNLLRLHRKNPFYFQEAFINHFEDDDYRELKERLLMGALLDYAWTELVMQQHSEIVINGLVEKELNELALKEYVETVLNEVIEETSGESADVVNAVNRKR